MNHNMNLNRYMNELVKNKELLEELKQDPVTAAGKHNLEEHLIHNIKDGDILALYRAGANPLLIMHLAAVLGFNVADRYQELLDKEKSTE